MVPKVHSAACPYLKGGWFYLYLKVRVGVHLSLNHMDETKWTTLHLSPNKLPQFNVVTINHHILAHTLTCQFHVGPVSNPKDLQFSNPGFKLFNTQYQPKIKPRKEVSNQPAHLLESSGDNTRTRATLVLPGMFSAPRPATRGPCFISYPHPRQDWGRASKPSTKY